MRLAITVIMIFRLNMGIAINKVEVIRCLCFMQHYSVSW